MEKSFLYPQRKIRNGSFRRKPIPLQEKQPETSRTNRRSRKMIVNRGWQESTTTEEEIGMSYSTCQAYGYRGLYPEASHIELFSRSCIVFQSGVQSTMIRPPTDNHSECFHKSILCIQKQRGTHLQRKLPDSLCCPLSFQ